MRFLMTIIWALLIGGALAYVLSSMAENPFNVTQSLVFSAAMVIIIFLLGGILKSVEPK